LAVVDAFLALDFVFRAIAAQDAGFVNVVSRVGNALASPFTGIFSHQVVPQVDHTTFWAALVAIVIYTVGVWILLRLLTLLSRRGYYRSVRP
jgi:roadblock/LC7 domain-containing protein